MSKLGLENVEHWRMQSIFPRFIPKLDIQLINLIKLVDKFISESKKNSSPKIGSLRLEMRSWNAAASLKSLGIIRRNRRVALVSTRRWQRRLIRIRSVKRVDNWRNNHVAIRNDKWRRGRIFKLEFTNWKLQIGNCRLEIADWKLERVEADEGRLLSSFWFDTAGDFQSASASALPARPEAAQLSAGCHYLNHFPIGRVVNCHLPRRRPLENAEQPGQRADSTFWRLICMRPFQENVEAASSPKWRHQDATGNGRFIGHVAIPWNYELICMRRFSGPRLMIISFA